MNVWVVILLIWFVFAFLGLIVLLGSKDLEEKPIPELARDLNRAKAKLFKIVPTGTGAHFEIVDPDGMSVDSVFYQTRERAEEVLEVMRDGVEPVLANWQHLQQTEESVYGR